VDIEIEGVLRAVGGKKHLSNPGLKVTRFTFA
jgi:hypothetical protein